MRTRFDFFLRTCCLIVSPSAFGATQDESWQNLRHVTRERYYTVLDRQSKCFTGHIIKTNDHEVTLKSPTRGSATFDHANVLRVSVSQAAPYFPAHTHADIARVRDIIYNNKSSWGDLKGLAGIEKIGVAGQSVRIVKKDGKKYEGPLSTIADAQLELEQLGGKLKIAKADIAQVYDLRYRPLSDSEKYSAQEDFWLDPRLWPYYLHLSPKMSVRLYDSSLPEDNTPARCENASNENAASLCFVGYVQTIDLANLTLRRQHNEATTMQLNRDTFVQKRGKQTGIDEIKVGDQIVACGIFENSGFVTKWITAYR